MIKQFEPWYLNKNQLSECLDISLRTIEEWRKIGLPHIKFRKQIYFEKRRVVEWLEENNQAKAAQNGRQ